MKQLNPQLSLGGVVLSEMNSYSLWGVAVELREGGKNSFLVWGSLRFVFMAR